MDTDLYLKAKELSDKGLLEEAREIYKSLAEQGNEESLVSYAWTLYKLLKKHIQEENYSGVKKCVNEYAYFFRRKKKFSHVHHLFLFQVVHLWEQPDLKDFLNIQILFGKILSFRFRFLSLCRLHIFELVRDLRGICAQGPQPIN